MIYVVTVFVVYVVRSEYVVVYVVNLYVVRSYRDELYVVIYIVAKDVLSS